MTTATATAPAPLSFPYFDSLCEHGLPVHECGCRVVFFDGHHPECCCYECDPEPEPPAEEIPALVREVFPIPVHDPADNEPF